MDFLLLGFPSVEYQPEKRVTPYLIWRLYSVPVLFVSIYVFYSHAYSLRCLEVRLHSDIYHFESDFESRLDVVKKVNLEDLVAGETKASMEGDAVGILE